MFRSCRALRQAYFLLACAVSEVDPSSSAMSPSTSMLALLGMPLIAFAVRSKQAHSVVSNVRLVGGVPSSALNSYDLMEPELMEFPPRHHNSFQLSDATSASKDSLLFKSRLRYLMSSECNLGKTLKVEKMAYSGFGGSLHNLVKPSLYAMKYGYCLKFPKHSSLYGNLDNYFETFSAQSKLDQHSQCTTCSADDFEAEPPCDPKLEVQVGRFMAGNCRREMKIVDASAQDVVPRSFAKMAVMEAVSNVVSTLYEPSKKMQSSVADAKKSMNWPVDRNVIGLHVRRGDSCNDDSQEWRTVTCFPLSKYMQLVDRAATKYRIKDIFLTSEAPATFEETKKYPYYNWMFLNTTFTPVPSGKNIENAIDDGDLDGVSVGEDAHSNLLLLSEASVIIGKFTSNLPRLALEYKTGKTSLVCPYYSLDSSWCFAYGEEYPLSKLASDDVERHLVTKTEDQDFNDVHKFYC